MSWKALLLSLLLVLVYLLLSSSLLDRVGMWLQQQWGTKGWTANQDCIGYHKNMNIIFWYKCEKKTDATMNICTSKCTRHGICQDLVEISWPEWVVSATGSHIMHPALVHDSMYFPIFDRQHHSEVKHLQNHFTRYCTPLCCTQGWCTTKKSVSRNRPWALLTRPSSTPRSLWPEQSAPAPGELQSSSPRGQTQTWPSFGHHRCSHPSPWHRRGRRCRTCSIKISEDGKTSNVYSQSKTFF